jgi:hypothetical protein
MRLSPHVATALGCAVAVVVAACSAFAASDQRSTGNVETHVAAPAPTAAEAATAKSAPSPATVPIDVKPQEPVRVVFQGDLTRKLVEGKASAAHPAVVLWTAPADKMLNAQLMTQGNTAALVIFQPGAKEPMPGTTPRDGAIRWIGATAKAGELRLEVHTKSVTDVAFKLGLEVAPEGNAEP